MRNIILPIGFLIGISVSLTSSLNSDKIECERVGPCSCLYPNDLVLDLSALAVSAVLPSNFSTASNGSHIYFYHPCQDAALNVSDVANAGVLWLFKANNVSASALDPNLALNKTYNGSFTLLATSAQSSFENTRINLNTASIKYINDTLESEVILDCVGAGSNYLEIHTPVESTVTHCLMLRGPLACPNDVPKFKHHLSTGSVLVVLFFTFSSIYFVGGCMVKKFLRGAQWPEMVPNIEFWSELPSLVKDGLVFAITCGRANPTTYESI